MFNKRKSIELNIRKVKFNSKGVIDFYWPYDKEFHTNIFSKFTLIFNEYLIRKKPEEIEPLVIFYKWFLRIFFLFASLLKLQRNLKKVILLLIYLHTIK